MSLFDRVIESPLFSKAKSSYEGLGERDQLAVKILLAFLVPVVIVVVVLLPSSRYMHEGFERYQAALENQKWMEANRSAVSAAVSAGGLEAGQSLFGVANSTSKGYQINFKRYEPLGDNALSLWIEKVSFNNLVLWLERLDKRHGVTVKEISVERQESEGQVNVRLVLQG